MRTITKKKCSNGFTLIELSIVILIIGLLMAFVLAASAAGLESARVKATQALITKLNVGLEERLEAILNTQIAAQRGASLPRVDPGHSRHDGRQPRPPSGRLGPHQRSARGRHRSARPDPRSSPTSSSSTPNFANGDARLSTRSISPASPTTRPDPTSTAPADNHFILPIGNSVAPAYVPGSYATGATRSTPAAATASRRPRRAPGSTARRTRRRRRSTSSSATRPRGTTASTTTTTASSTTSTKGRRPRRATRGERRGPARVTQLPRQPHPQDRPGRDALCPPGRGPRPAGQRLRGQRLPQHRGQGHRQRRRARVRRRLGRADPVLPLARRLPVGLLQKGDAPLRPVRDAAAELARSQRAARHDRLVVRQLGNSPSRCSAKNGIVQNTFGPLADPNWTTRASCRSPRPGTGRGVRARRAYFTKFLIVSGGPDRQVGIPRLTDSAIRRRGFPRWRSRMRSTAR